MSSQSADCISAQKAFLNPLYSLRLLKYPLLLSETLWKHPHFLFYNIFDEFEIFRLFLNHHVTNSNRLHAYFWRKHCHQHNPIQFTTKFNRFCYHAYDLQNRFCFCSQLFIAPIRCSTCCSSCYITFRCLIYGEFRGHRTKRVQQIGDFKCPSSRAQPIEQLSSLYSAVLTEMAVLKCQSPPDSPIKGM